MPTLQELQGAVTTANSAYQAALSRLSAAQSTAQTRYDELKRCHCGKGKREGKCAPLKTVPSFGQMASASECWRPQALDECTTDCCKQETCEGRVRSYNDSVSELSAANGDVPIKKTALDNAQAALDNFIKTDPDALQQYNQQQSEAKNTTIKWIFFGLMMLIIIGGGFWMAMKTDIKKGYIVGGGAFLAIVAYLLFFGIKRNNQ